MNTPRYARLAAKVLTKEADDAARVPLALVASASSASRDDAIAAIEKAIAAHASRKRVMRRGSIAAAGALTVAAACAGLYVHHAHVVASNQAPRAPEVVAHPSGDGATLVGASSSPMVDGQALATGSRVVARPSGRALLAFATGTEVTLEDEGDLTIVDGGPAKTFALSGGAMRAKVAKLHDGERFVVRTADAEVEVRGTSFRVGVAPPDAQCGAGTTTRLEVFEGTVVVRHDGAEVAVGAGDEWPRGCRAAAQSAEAPHVQAQPRPAASPASQTPRASVQTPTPVHAPASTLADQNDAFADAVAAKRAGDARGAIARFDSFLAKYPSSALAESAAAQRMKLLHDVDPSRAGAAARAYLARWPNGFARADAEAMAETP